MSVVLLYWVLSVFGWLCVCVCVYRREKVENDRILQEQMDTYREESSKLRLDNAKLTSKVLITMPFNNVTMIIISKYCM